MTVYHGPSNPQNTATVIVPKVVREMNEPSTELGYRNNGIIKYYFFPNVLIYTGIWAKAITRMNLMGEIKLYKPTVQDPSGDNAYAYSVDLLSACFGIDDTYGSNWYGAWKKTQFVQK
jgi:hypothetical protein